ncbi:MAG: hypothetical protein WBW04_22745 [Nitrolancea sp.]
MPSSGVATGSGADRPVGHPAEESNAIEPILGNWLGAATQLVRRPLVRATLLVLTFVIFTVGMLWPLPLHASSAVQDLGDPLYEIWTMRWVQHQLAANPSHLWDGNMGYPFADSLLFSEPRISTSVIAWPIQILSGNDVLTYNLILLGSYVLVGVGMAFVILEITDEAGPAILTGFLAAFVPYRYGHLSHLNLLSYGWGLLALWLLLRFARMRQLRDAVLGAILLSVQTLASDTLGVMAFFVIGCAMLVVLWQERQRLEAKLWGGLLLFLAIPGVAELPVALARLHVDRMYDFNRDLDTVAGMSATFQTYWSVSPGNHFWDAVGLLPSTYPGPLFPGVVATLAALIGLYFAVRRWPQWTMFGAMITVIGFVLSLGPYTSINGHRFRLPYYVLYLHVPGFDAMRDASRFGMLTLIGVEILAGLGLAALWTTMRTRLPGRRRSILGIALLASLLVVASVELKTNVGTATVPKDSQTTAVYDWLANQPVGPVIEFPSNGLWANLGWTIQEIYYSTRHWDPIVAAYTSFIPQRDIDLLVAINGGTDTPSLVNTDNVGLLQDLGIRYVVIHQWPGYDARTALAEASTLPELTRVGQFGDATVFMLDKGNRVPVVHSIQAPTTAAAGRQVVAAILTRNDNATVALDSLDEHPTASFTWTSSSGDVVSNATVPALVEVTAKPGLSTQPVLMTAPSTPGNYQLTIRCTCVDQPLVQVVNVTESGNTPEPSDPELVLRHLSLPLGPYQPGQWLSLTSEWNVLRQPDRDLTMTVQLIDDSNHVIAQWDGLPFGEQLPTDEWHPGADIDVPILVRVPSDTNASTVKVLIALYDHASPTLEHTRFKGPDGVTADQYLTRAIDVTSRQ